MSVDLDLWGDSLESREDFAKSIFNWLGRDITWEDLPALQSHLEHRMMNMLTQENEHLFYKLAWLGAPLGDRPLLEREIEQLLQNVDSWEIQRTGGPVHSYKKLKKKTGHAWKKTCEFCDERQKEILIGVAVVATVAAATAIIIYTGGSAAPEVITGGVALLQAFSGDEATERPLNKAPYSPAPPSIALDEEFTFFRPLEAPSFPEPIIANPPPVHKENPPIQKPLYPQLDPQILYGEDYLTDLYRQFNFPPPNQFPPQGCEPPPIPQTPNQQFVDLIQNKLAEAQSPTYKDQFRKEPPPTYEETLYKIQERFGPPEVALASQPKQPYVDVPRLGHSHQSTVHFHCGISNNFNSIVEGGLVLNESFDGAFAIQPHLIHPESLPKGLAYVGLEKLPPYIGGLTGPEVGKQLIKGTHIQTAIDYEVEILTQMAQNIIEQSNPNLKQVHVTFSNGGYIFKAALEKLSPEHRDTIIVITTGTTALIENHLAHKVYNIIGDKDQASIICNGGMAAIQAARARGIPVEMIPQTEIQSLVGGHYCTQPEYQKHVSERIVYEIKAEYEIH